MDAPTIRKLLEINRQFYADFGERFSATRHRIQPGVLKTISRWSGTEHILDLGCGNGELARVLAQTGFHGTYVGLDFSLPLLSEAKSQPEGFSATFYKADLNTADWDLAAGPARYSLITAFAVLHHIPGMDMRRSILHKIHNLLEPQGKFIHSNWQFLNSERLRARIQPWEAAELYTDGVDEGDYLLDWRGGGLGLRYVHHFSDQELQQLASQTGFKVVEKFFSDGEGGKLGLYQTWERYENKI